MTRTLSGSVTSGSKRVTTAGTAEVISATTLPVLWVTIQSESDNTLAVALGDSGVDVTAGTTADGVFLSPGDSIAFGEVDLGHLYVDVSTSGDGVVYIYGRAQ